MRFALRTLRRQCASLVLAVSVLALGCGTSTAVFSLVQAVLLRPLPYSDPSALRVIWKSNPRTGLAFIELAYPELGDLQQNVKAFSSVAVMPTTLYGYGRILRAGASPPVQIETAPVSHDFFRTLGVTPALGRDFTQADEHQGAPPAVILSDTVWRAHFQSNPGVIGRQIRLSGTGFIVIGVMSPAIDFPRGAGMWLPLGVTPAREMRGATYLQAIARVRPGYSDARVHAQLNALNDRMARQYPQNYSSGQRAVVTALPEYLTGSARPQLLLALAASLLLLAAACVTASNLFLSRTLRRRHEIAIRLSLGATPRRIAAQFVFEGIFATALATSAGTIIASLLIRLLVFLAPQDIPGIALAGIHAPVLLFAGLITLLTVFACSAAPALVAARFTFERVTVARSSLRLQNAFTLAQTALTVVLLTVSLLAVLSVRAMLRTDTGFANRDAVTFNLALRGLDSKARTSLYSALLERLRASPGVTNAGAVLLRPLEGTIGWEMKYQPEFAATTTSLDLPTSEFEVITPGYFQTVGTPLLEGRDFSDRDKADSEKTIIISRSLAAKFRQRGHNPLGLRMRLGSGGDAWLKIVGVVADSRYRGVTTAVDTVYTNFLQTGIPVNYLAVRGRASEQELTALVRTELARLDSTQAIASVASIGKLIDANTASARFNTAVLFTFGFAALLLAAAGIYSVVSESVSVRRREIAIRTALGAARPLLTRRIIQTPLTFVLLGEIAGALTICLMYPATPALLGSVLAFLLVVSFVAAAIPAWIAGGREPYPVLQSE